MVRLTFARAAAQGRVASFKRRMIALLRVEIKALTSAATDAERAKVAVRIYQRGYGNGKSAEYQRLVVQERRRA